MDKDQIRAVLLDDITRLKSPDGYLYAGIPKFRRLFGRDSCITALELLDLMPEMARSTLELLARLQGKHLNIKKEEEPGKILHEHYLRGLPEKLQRVRETPGHKWLNIKQFFTWGFPYYGSIDSTGWFFILLAAYWRKTHDSEFVKRLWPNVQRALIWVETYGDFDRDTFIEYRRKNPNALFHQAWKDAMNIEMKPPIAMCEVQGYYYLSYIEMGNLAESVMGDLMQKLELHEKARILKDRFNSAFWMAGEQFFAFALDGDKKQISMITSNPGQLLFTGIIEDERVGGVVRRLFQDDLWTPYGIRTLSMADSLFDPESYQKGSIWPHDNWIIYTGLEKLGYQEEAGHIKEALLKAFSGLGKIPELYSVKDNTLIPLKISCYPQAWATGALLSLLESEYRDR